ncbi:hypothetical protein [Acinetobacter sp. YH12236]|uniref:hypothetical protein n=1 Tax=Acinetobacter sp. YH12236 TaxID=2601163 RepID=UPI0015D13BBE|nr:hypothetical protein [Acinetobacter sp. YH12236]
MATDVDVQYFSHLNGLTLGNNWGDLIRLLDKALVTGIDFTQITAASIDAQGDVHITLYAAHNAMLFQVVELSGFTPSSLNQKYRIKGVPNTTQLILKPQNAIAGTTITTRGTGRLAPLGYEIIFRDANDVKRVYRAKNPSAQHPFIRVDESLASDTGSYNSNYAKYAMVGLLENMEHIDDYENPDVLQLPFDPANPAKNWKITGTGASVVRGWSIWVYAKAGTGSNSTTDSATPQNGNRAFSLVGDCDAFYLLNQPGYEFISVKCLRGCGLFNSTGADAHLPPWFLFSHYKPVSAGTSYSLISSETAAPLQISASVGASYCLKAHPATSKGVVETRPIMPDFESGRTGLYTNSSVAALEIPFADTDKLLRGSYKHVCYSGNTTASINTTPILSESSMYISDSACASSGAVGGFYFYLGEFK